MRRRVVVCLALLVTLCLLGGAIAMLCLDGSIAQLSGLAESHRIQVMRADLVSTGVRIEADLLAFCTGHRDDRLQRQDSLARFEASVNDCSGCHHSPSVQAQLDDLHRTFDLYRQMADQFYGESDPTLARLRERDTNRMADQLLRQATAMSDMATKHLVVRSSDAAASVGRARFVLIGTLATALVMGALIALHLQRRLTRPVAALLAGIGRLRQGDLTYRFDIEGDEEFRALGEALNIAHENLRRAHESVFQAEKMAAVGKLAAGVAHEVGNPLASISSIAQMMRRNCESPTQAERIDLIMEQIARISRIVRELLTFSRPAPEKWKGRVQIADSLQRATTLLGFDKRAKNVQIRCTTDPDLRDVRGDADKLLLVFTNIILNAFDALTGHRNGAAMLNISARQDGDDVVLRFEDNGPGLNEAQLAAVFEPFFTTKEPGAGTGLGLWVCYQIIQRHQGRIWMESEEGSGAAVVIRLPCEPPSAPPPSAFDRAMTAGAADRVPAAPPAPAAAATDDP